MSKNKTNGLPTITTGSSQATQTLPAAPPQIVAITVEVPAMALDDGGYAARFVQLRLNERQARKLRSIQLGLEQHNAKLADGSYVNTPLDAVRWMLENFE